MKLINIAKRCCSLYYSLNFNIWAREDNPAMFFFVSTNRNTHIFEKVANQSGQSSSLSCITGFSVGRVKSIRSFLYPNSQRVSWILNIINVQSIFPDIWSGPGYSRASISFMTVYYVIVKYGTKYLGISLASNVGVQ